MPYEVGHCAFKNLARAQMTDERVGMLKIIFHAETLEVLGVHCFGDGASEIVHIGQTVMASRDLNDIRYFTQHHVQLSDHGRGVSGRGVQRDQPADVKKQGCWDHGSGPLPRTDNRVADTCDTHILFLHRRSLQP